MIVLPDSARIALVAELIAATNFLDAVTCHLFQANYAPLPTTVLADLTAIEADFDGYAASGSLVWGGVYINTLHQAITAAAKLEFPSDDPQTKPQTIFGYWLQAAGPTLRYAEAFGSPIPINVPGDAVVLYPVFSFGQ